VVAEVGINHDGLLERAQQLIRMAAWAGADAVKLQARTPRLCVPRELWDQPKDTPWGETLPYLEYRERMEFDEAACQQLQRTARRAGVALFWSIWDHAALERTERLAPPVCKIPSAGLSNLALVSSAARSVATRGGEALVLSTGMSTQEDVDEAVSVADQVLSDATPSHLERPVLWLLHCHSAYPAPIEELNLLLIPALAYRYDGKALVGYRGHEYGRAPTEWAVALGAGMVERHITLDRSAPGSDHASSLEPWAFKRLVRHIRSLERALGDGKKRVWPSELRAMERLRGHAATEAYRAAAEEAADDNE